MNLKLLVFLLVSMPFFALSQPTGSVTVVGGSNVIFIFNSLGKYKDGASLNSWTKLRVKYDDPGSVTTHWVLQVSTDEADPNRSNFISDGGDLMGLDYFSIKVTSIDEISGTFSGTISDVILQDTYNSLIESDNSSTVDLMITLSFDFGKAPSLSLLQPPPPPQPKPGFYIVYLQFNLYGFDL